MDRQQDPTKAAERRYLRRMFLAMVAFLACTLGLSLMRDAVFLSGPAGYILALVPVGLLLFAFWAFLRFLADVDEFIRAVHTRGAWFGLIVMLTVATAWGYFELFLDAPDLPIFWLNPLFWASYGLATTVLSRRFGLPI